LATAYFTSLRSESGGRGDRGVISDDVLHRLEQELDIEAIRIGLGEARRPGEADP
jgi:hypothetical protein